MRAIIVVSVEVPEPEDLQTALSAMDVTNIPFFAHEVRVAIEPTAQAVIEWLDDES